MLLTFIVPVVLVYIFGSIFGGSNAGPQGIPLAFLNQSKSEVGTRIESALDTMKSFRVIKSFKDDSGIVRTFDTTSIKEYVMNGNATAALVLPIDAYSDTSMALKIKFYYDPKNEIEIQTVQGLIKQVVFSQFPSIIAQSGLKQAERALGTKNGREFNRGMASVVSKYFKVDTSVFLHPSRWKFSGKGGDSSNNTGNFFNEIVKMDEEQVVGKELANPWATRSVGGWAITFLLFSLTAASSSLFDEKKSGVMLRLLTSPVSRVHILWSKYLFNMSLGILQLSVLFFFGWVIFRIDIFSNFINLFLIIIAASLACTSFGMLLAAFSKTRQQANGLGTLLILSMSAIGGAWFPVSFMPSGIQFFSRLTPVYWAMDGFLQVLWRGVGLSGIVEHIVILVGIGAVASVVSLWQFKRGDIFS